MLYNPNTASELLLRAADIMEKRGLARGRLMNSDGVCVQGALMSALGYSDNEIWHHTSWGAQQNTGYSTAMATLFKMLPQCEAEFRFSDDLSRLHRYRVASWNNHRAKDKHEVAAKMREAAQVLVAA